MSESNNSTFTKSIELSPREAEVLMWTACGKTGSEISEFLDLSEETIRTHIKSSCKKLNAANKTHAAAIAISHGILSCGPSPKRVIPLTTLFGLSKNSVSPNPLLMHPNRPNQKKSLRNV